MQAATELPNSAPTTAALRSLYAIAGGGALVNVFRSVHGNAAAGTLWMDPYWVNFYLTRYSDGYRRRALMGSVLSHVFRGGISIVTLNVLAALVTVAAFALLFRALSGMIGRNPTAWAKVFLFALAASALTAAFYETMGDLLQWCLVLTSVGAMLALRLVRSEWVRLALALAVAGVCFLLHEASVFLVVPALPFLLKARPRVRDFLVPLVALGLLLALSVHWSERSPRPAFPVVLLDHRTITAELGVAPALRWNLEAESKAYFGTPAGRLYFAGRFPRILALALAYVLALVNCLPRRSCLRALRAFGFIWMLSLPLWVIAVDWGRFLSYAFVLAVVSAWLWEGDVASTPDGDVAPRAAEAVWRWLVALNRRDLIRLGAVFLLLTGPEWPATHIDSGPLANSLAFWALVAAALCLPQRRAAVDEA